MNWQKYAKVSTFKRALTLLLALAIIFALAACKNGEGGRQDEEDVSPTVNPEDVVQPPTISVQPSSDVEVVSPSVEPSEEVVAPPVIPLQEAADDAFFEDAAFMGNSLMDGFRMFSGLTTCDYYAATSMSVIGATSNNCITLDNGSSGTMLDGLTQKPYGKIYILLGINEIGMNVTAFIDAYSAMLDKIITAQPDCTIYVMSISPVSANKSASSSDFNMKRIGEYNEALYKMAEAKGCYYMDLVEALADSTGFLPANETTDGVHFSANLYKIWTDYVRTHYV